MTTSPEALREAEPVKCLGERFQDAFLRGWGDDRLVAYADLPAEAQAKWNRAALAFVCTLSDAPTELQSALQEARGALDVFSKVGRLIDGPFGPGRVPDDGVFQSGCAWREGDQKRTLTWGDFRRAAEVYRALSHGGADE